MGCSKHLSFHKIRGYDAKFSPFFHNDSCVKSIDAVILGSGVNYPFYFASVSFCQDHMYVCGRYSFKGTKVQQTLVTPNTGNEFVHARRWAGSLITVEFKLLF